MRSNPRRRRYHRHYSSDPAENAGERIQEYESGLLDYEEFSPDDEDRPLVPTRPQFKFEELAAVAQECIRSLNARPYYTLAKALSFTDEETAVLFRPLREKVIRLRVSSADVDREIVNLRSVMIERELGAELDRKQGGR